MIFSDLGVPLSVILTWNEYILFSRSNGISYSYGPSFRIKDIITVYCEREAQISTQDVLQ